ncbi:glutamate--tRNA ligase, partial [Candidatus Babeliales bacterium]|nr:glutamate--tRNA ligase [Candidatus Babeliales bacterium]
QSIAQQLIEQGQAYLCFCTQEELEHKRQRATQKQETYQYDRSCRNLNVDALPKDKAYVIRFKVQTESPDFVFDDQIKGSITIPSEQIDDFVLLRSDGTVTYNFAVVVDDIESKITHIIRGEEHLFNTPKQILLYQALHALVPKFAHIPLILGSSGQKLSKRDGATSVIDYKTEGYLPHALCNYLVRLGWSHENQEIFSTEEMINYFSLSGIQHSGAKFDMEKLKWVNNHYIKLLRAEDILQMFAQALGKDLVAKTPDFTDEQRYAWIKLYQDRVATLKELYDLVVAAYFLPVRYDWESLHQLIAKDVVIVLQLLQQELRNVSFEKNILSGRIKDFCKTHEYKVSDIAQLLRFVILGSVSGPSVFEMMQLLGSQEIQRRISIVLAEL